MFSCLWTAPPHVLTLVFYNFAWSHIRIRAYRGWRPPIPCKYCAYSRLCRLILALFGRPVNPKNYFFSSWRSKSFRAILKGFVLTQKHHRPSHSVKITYPHILAWLLLHAGARSFLCRVLKFFFVFCFFFVDPFSPVCSTVIVKTRWQHSDATAG